MNNRQRLITIKGLECHKIGDDGLYSCGTCPYTILTADTCADALNDDALALLREQEPRVMTSDDMEEAEPGTIVWCEQRDEIRTYMAPMIKYDDGYFENRFLGADSFAAELPNIRFWTSCPSDEQRQATAWEK